MSVGRNVDLGLLQLQVLWLLSKKKSCGYELMKELNALKKTSITQGVLYPVLAGLMRREIIRVSGKGTRGKKFYVVTALGKRELKRNCLEFLKTFAGVITDYKCSLCGCGK